MNTKLILAGLLLVGGAIVALAGAAPQAALSPSQALDQEPEQGVVVKGMVADVDASQDTFTLTDGQANLTVTLGHDLPAQVQEGTALVAKGDLITGEDGTRLAATEVVIGCPSKYQA